MARADVHYALAVDRDIYEASTVDPTLLDPVVRVDGGLPGPAKPFVVVRDYQGPGGLYTEHFVLTSPGGTEVARSEVQRINLQGEMFEDRFETLLTEVMLYEGGEHTLTFFVDDDDVGAIPVFIETATGGDPRVAARETFTSAVKKGSILWLTVTPQEPRRRQEDHSQAVWYVLDGDRLYVLTGPTEQQIPGLVDAERVTLTARSKDHRSAIAKVPARVRTVDPGDETWPRIIKQMLSKRLNLHDGEAAEERWRENCTLVELQPEFQEAETVT